MPNLEELYHELNRDDEAEERYHREVIEAQTFEYYNHVRETTGTTLTSSENARLSFSNEKHSIMEQIPESGGLPF